MDKLLIFQEKVGAISKDSKNPFFKSFYFDINKLLEEVKPILTELKLVINQPLSNIEGKPAIRTILTDCEANKVLFDDTITLPENNDPQKMGSAITYFRRYALQSLLALQAEDDDGNLAKQTDIKSDKKSFGYVDKLKSKVFSLGAKSDDEACDIIENQSGIRIGSVKDLTEKKAEEILNLFIN